MSLSENEGIHEDLARFFGASPLIQGEASAQWEAMRKHISAAIGPLDFLE